MNITPRLHWFAVRVTYGRELALKAFLDEEKIENFIPMRRDYVVKDGRRICKFVPAVHNLVFIRSTRKRIDTLKDRAGMNIPIRYIMNRENHLPVIVPEDQMRSFILVAGTYEESVIYVEPAELQLVRGQKVRVKGEFSRVQWGNLSVSVATVVWLSILKVSWLLQRLLFTLRL